MTLLEFRKIDSVLAVGEGKFLLFISDKAVCLRQYCSATGPF